MFEKNSKKNNAYSERKRAKFLWKWLGALVVNARELINLS